LGALKFYESKTRIEEVATCRYHRLAQSHLTIASGLFVPVRAGKTAFDHAPMRKCTINGLCDSAQQIEADLMTINPAEVR